MGNFLCQKSWKVRDLTRIRWHCSREKSEVYQMLIGYRRSSTTEQIAGYEAQEASLLATGCTRVFGEMVSSVAQRDQLEAAIAFARDGDVLITCRLDRLSRGTADLLSIVARLEAKGVALRILDFGGSEINTRSATGKLLLTLIAAVAEAERTTILERMRAGIAKAKADGKYRGRAPTARRLAPQVREMRASGFGASAIAAQLGISRASVHRIVAECAA
jgi:DNA invertase Pin-like site-specific DNA recombinase